jgi:hypothetical protein
VKVCSPTDHKSIFISNSLVPYFDFGFRILPYGTPTKAVWTDNYLFVVHGTGGQSAYGYVTNPTVINNWGVTQFGTDLAGDGSTSWTGCWLTPGKLIGCGSHPTLTLYPLGSSVTFVSLSGGYMTNGRYVTIRESDNQMIGFVQFGNNLISGSIVNIDTPVVPSDVSYNGNYISIASLTKQVYCSAGYGMLPGVEVPWTPLDIALSSINVGTTGTIIGIDANQNLIVSPNCIKPFWIKASNSKFIQVSMVDGNNVFGTTDANQIIQSSSLNYVLIPFSKAISASQLTLGDGLLSRVPHGYNDHNPIILEKQYEKKGTSYLRVLANSMRIFSCSEPPCYDSQSSLKFVFQDGIFSSYKGLCVNQACLSESQILKLVEMIEYFYTSEDY